MMMSGGGASGRALMVLSMFSSSSYCIRPFPLPTLYIRFNQTLCFSASAFATEKEASVNAHRHSVLLERLRMRHLKEASKGSPQRQAKLEASRPLPSPAEKKNKKKQEEESSNSVASSFEVLGLSEEVMCSVREMGISVPTEIQSIGIPAVLQGKNVVLGSHTGSGKTLAYLLPLVQLLRHDEQLSGMMMKPRRPRAIVLCPTRELTEQVFRVAKSISHHARFRSTMISGGGRSRPQEDSLNAPIDMVVGTPGRILQHVDDGNIVYGDIRFLVLDEADTMFDKGFGPDIRKFIGPLKKRAAKSDDQGFQTIMVTATMTKAVQKLVDEEFEGIIHLQTSTLHKKVASARHDFIKISGSENKLESLLQVLAPSLARGNKVMVFCNTLNSSRAVDHFLTENQIYTVNYHGEVPAEERVENLRKFKSDEGDCPTLVCTDLAARGLDLDVDHVIMFDFPLNSIDYLHRTGRTARMGAKGKITSLVAKRDLLLADRIEEALRKNESLESLNASNVRKDVVRSKQVDHRVRNPKSVQKSKPSSSKSSVIGRKAALALSHKMAASKPGGKSANKKSKRIVSPSKPSRASKGKRVTVNRKSAAAEPDASKLNVVGFRGQSSGKKEAS
ncbi:hypothetical protein HPP92_003269 [Vanilla planifolia]|uniref:DEAD-box ATP-dependent RNA helicase 39 n=1 Tax=Vanilla planifolia TaxID=51239 RepID=A0A835VLB8_VANPL|nr:hypothetical protein HPP92_003269 [Vanilla planifolia]